MRQTNGGDSRQHEDALNEALSRRADAEQTVDVSGSSGAPEATGEAIEPRVNPDSNERLHEELYETPHPASRFDAGTGQGTISETPRHGDKLEHPILDGSTESFRFQATVPNPNRGDEDPAAMKRQPALNTSNTNRWLISSVIAAAVMTIVLLLLMPWNPVLCGIGVTTALVGVLAMLVVRASGIGLKVRLRIDAVLMAIVWLVPLVIFIIVLLTSADQIWGVVS